MLALCDGLVYAELGAALPGSGGPYVYLREAYRPFGLGRLAAFVFIFQVMLVAPLSIAGGAVGFADYLGFYWKTMGPMQHNLVAAALCVVVTALRYRDIASIGRLAVADAGRRAGDRRLGDCRRRRQRLVVAGVRFSARGAAARCRAGLGAIGAAGLLAMYNYGGYNNVCNIGDELREPERTMPRAIVLSIVVVVALYVVMSTRRPRRRALARSEQTRTIASLFIARTFSDPAHRSGGGAGHDRR